MRKRILVIEDGSEYADFARLVLANEFEIFSAGCLSEAMAVLGERSFDGLLFDLRFERCPLERLTGDVEATARRLFAGDRERAVRYVVDQQGILILAALREAGHDTRAVFVQDFPARRLENLRALYGDVEAVPGFDGAEIRRKLGHE